MNTSSQVSSVTGGAMPTGGPGLPAAAGLQVFDDQVAIDGVDLTAINHALTGLGTDGSRAFDARRKTRQDVGTLVRVLEETRSALAAVQARAVATLTEVTRNEADTTTDTGGDGGGADDDTVVADRKTAFEVSLAGRMSPATARRRLGSSIRLVENMPGMLDALAKGRISPEVAHGISRALGPVQSDQRRRVDRALVDRIPHMDGAGVRRWSDEVDAIVHALDPGRAAGRHQIATRERSVTLRKDAHGMATLSAKLTAIDAALAFKHLSLEAERLRADGDRRGHQTIMAGAFADTLIGRAGGMDPVTLDLGVVITDHTLLHPGGGDVARLEGYGTIASSQIRNVLEDALHTPAPGEEDPYGPDGPAMRTVLRRLYTHPRSGELVAAESVARAFPDGLARLLRLRGDGICAAPYCEAGARQIDHILPHAHGGTTSLVNGQPVCAACNQKETFTATVHPTHNNNGDDGDGDGGHRVEWTSEAGQTVTTSVPALDPRAPYQQPPHTPRHAPHCEHDPTTTPDRTIRDRTYRPFHLPPLPIHKRVDHVFGPGRNPTRPSIPPRIDHAYFRPARRRPEHPTPATDEDDDPRKPEAPRP